MIPNAVLVTPPALMPIGLSPVKTFLRVDGTDEDALITNMIKAATKRLEAETDRKFVTQTWDIYYDCFPSAKPGNQSNQWWDGTRDGAINQLYPSEGGKIKMPFGPCSELTYFKTYDNDSTPYTMPSTDYYVDTVTAHPSVGLKLGAVWPTTVLRPSNGIVLRGVFGFGVGYTDANNVGATPEDIQEAIKQMVGIMYEHRGDEMPKIPTTVSMLIEPYRSMKL